MSSIERSDKSAQIKPGHLISKLDIMNRPYESGSSVEENDLQRLKSKRSELKAVHRELKPYTVLLGPEQSRQVEEIFQAQTEEINKKIGIQQILAAWENKYNLAEQANHDPTQIVNAIKDPEKEGFARQHRREMAEKEYLRRQRE